MPNRLADETSPYLQQHKDNPVDWYPWADDAFAEARRRDVPVLLSVGYSACHWCHVMAHESFEDPDVAAVMNELFVNVKVDREERPDVDAIYMDATQAMTGAGGWPMTVFLTPDGRPFYAGTYFPPRTSHGRPGFVDLLHAVAEAWRSRRDDVEQQADQLSEAVRARSTFGADFGVVVDAEGGTASVDGPARLGAAYERLRAAFDPHFGGFGGAPKFPQVTFLELVARAYAHNRSPGTLAMLTTTLDAMASGGIYDHLGGGFARYSVDAQWLVPHFEKMLYDQAQLLRAYVHGWQLTGRPEWRQVAEEIVAYVLRDLRAADGGGVWSAEDADSEGVEGRFYVWSLDEVRRVLGDGDGQGGLADVAVEWYGVTEAGNFEGANILWRPRRGELLRPPEVEEARRRLLEARSSRVRPGLDDKVLTEWNAMFVSALAEAGAALGRGDWLDAAADIAEFLLASLRRPSDGRWLRSWQRGRANPSLLAYAADHAWLVDAFTRLGEARGEARWITEARTAADALLSLFEDREGGGFFTAGDDAEQLLVRQKDHYDGATPSANGVAAVALARLGALAGEARYVTAAERTLSWLAPAMVVSPQAFTTSLAAADLLWSSSSSSSSSPSSSPTLPSSSGTTEIVVPGRDRPDLVRAVHESFLPSAVLAWGEAYASPLWEGRSPGVAYVCRNYACQLPASTVEELRSQLGLAPG